MRLMLFPVFLSTIAHAFNQKATAQDIIQHLRLQPNVEGGYFRETFRDARTDGNRSVSTVIYYLLEGSAGWSYWHRMDAVEVWHYYAGAPLALEMSWDNVTATERVLIGKDLFNRQEPQGVVPAYRWQRARSAGGWTLLGTMVAPGFVPDGFELREDWTPDIDYYRDRLGVLRRMQDKDIFNVDVM